MDQVGEVRFPAKGIDRTDEVARQAPLTTPVGVNVRVFDVFHLRGRGGSRPGLLGIPPGLIPAGHHLIEDLNTVITTEADAVPVTVPDYPNPVFSLPATPGLPQYWGFFPDGSPRDTRAPQTDFPPGGSGYAPHKSGRETHHLVVYGPSAVKTFGDVQTWTPGEPFFTGFLAPADTITATYSSAGDGAGAAVGTYPVNPAPTVVSHTGDVYVIDRLVPGTLVVVPIPPASPTYCWGGELTIRISAPGNPFGFDGQLQTFSGTACASAQPGTSEVCKVTSDYLSVGLPAGTVLLDYAARWLLTKVLGTSTATGTVTQDHVSHTHSTLVCAGDGCADIVTDFEAASPGAVNAVISAG